MNKSIFELLRMKQEYKYLRPIVYILTTIFIGGIFFMSYTTAVNPSIDSHIYDLPFEPGEKHRVVQGYGGLFSHQHIAAIDFGMPVGTPIYAARGGRIYSYRDQFNQGGILPKYKNKANYIMIAHDDGTFGCYWHLKKEGVVVKNGRVKQGQLIGYSGATGQVVRPHLHFSVKRELNYDKSSFLRTKFRTSDGVILLKTGRSYQQP